MVKDLGIIAIQPFQKGRLETSKDARHSPCGSIALDLIERTQANEHITSSKGGLIKRKDARTERCRGR